MVLDRYAVLALAFPLACAVNAQSITLVAPGNVPTTGSSFLVHVAPYMAPEAGGAGMSFDFSALTPTSSLTYEWTTSNVSPNAGLFPTATLALINGGPDTVFYKATTVGLERVGETRTITAFGNFPAGYSDGVIEMPLPITFGDTWTDPIAGSFTIDGTAATRSGAITGSADAHGFLTVPNGTTPVEVLRLNSVVNETINTSISGIPVAIQHKRHVAAYYTLWGKIPVFRTVTDSLSAFGTTQADNFTEWLDASAVGVADADLETAALQVFPNPASLQATVVFASASNVTFDVQVIDARGAVVQHTQTMGRTMALDVSKWEAGQYQVVLTHPDGRRSVRPLVVAH